MVLLKPQILQRIACISVIDFGPNFSQLGFLHLGHHFALRQKNKSIYPQAPQRRKKSRHHEENRAYFLLS